jgi:hypothetical protein
MAREYRVPISMVKKLRRFMQDFPEANELVDGEESPDTFLAEMLVDAMNRYNLIEPSSPTINIESIENVGPEVELLLVDEAAARILTSVSIRMQRNMIDVTDGNIRKLINDKWQYYNQSIARLRGGDAGNGFDKLVKERKVRENCDGAWGYIPSELYDGMRVPSSGFISVIM